MRSDYTIPREQYSAILEAISVVYAALEEAYLADYKDGYIQTALTALDEIIETLPIEAHSD